MKKRRYKIVGTVGRDESGWGFPTPEYVDADNPDEAANLAGGLYDKIDRVREVPWDEGRGLLWRLWRRIKG